jgi:lysophospholipase L1-like esterase
MKTILCYGDSNTWGYDPVKNDRMDINTRWPGVMRNILGQDYHVIEEGLPGRTTVWDDPIEEDKNGKQYLRPCLASHAPLDLVVLMLGTNDCKHRFSLTAYDIAMGIDLCVTVIQQSGSGIGGESPEILIVSPPPTAEHSGNCEEMFSGSQEKSRLLSKHFNQVALNRKCRFMNAGDIISVSDIDGIHFGKSSHATLGARIASEVKSIL